MYYLDPIWFYAWNRKVELRPIFVVSAHDAMKFVNFFFSIFCSILVHLIRVNVRSCVALAVVFGLRMSAIGHYVVVCHNSGRSPNYISVDCRWYIIGHSTTVSLRRQTSTHFPVADSRKVLILNRCRTHPRPTQCGEQKSDKYPCVNTVA